MLFTLTACIVEIVMNLGKKKMIHSIDVGHGKIWEIDLKEFNYLSCLRCGVNVVSYGSIDFHLCIKCFNELKQIERKKENENGLEKKD